MLQYLMINPNQKLIKRYLRNEGIINDNKYYPMKLRFHGKKNEIIDNINKCLTHINENAALVEKLYWIMNDLSNYPKTCKMCSNKIKKFNTGKEPYKADYCSNKCSRNCPTMKQKIHNTLSGRSDEENRNITKKRQHTNLKKYGHVNAAHSEIIREKIKQTMIERYGVENALNSSDIQERIKKTNLKKYGVENAGGSNTAQEKIKNTNIERYGVKSTFQVREFKEKAKQTMIDRYGVDHNMKSPEIRKKTKETMLERYGVENIFNCRDIQTVIQDNKKRKFYNNLLSRTCDMVKPLFSEEEYIGIANTYDWQCTQCDNIISGRLVGKVAPRCLVCYPLHQSVSEQEVKDFLTQLNINIIENDRSIIKPKELDIVIPEKKIAIEYCGLYWHSELMGKDKIYHKNKFDQAQAQGYQLITIFEDEWINKKEICKERLKHILGINHVMCYARQTTIKEITNKEHKYFLNTQHIQGHVGAKIKLGAYYNDELVAVMSFGKKRRALGNKTQNDDTYELLRFCLLGSIPGIGSKLFKYFTRNHNPEEIISYCDLRWGTGAFYEKLGFKLSHTSGPNYWYLNNNGAREYRFAYRKQALTEMASYSSEKTEWQIMQEEGYDRIWDCGNKVFKWRNGK